MWWTLLDRICDSVRGDVDFHFFPTIFGIPSASAGIPLHLSWWTCLGDWFLITFPRIFVFPIYSTTLFNNLTYALPSCTTLLFNLSTQRLLHVTCMLLVCYLHDDLIPCLHPFRWI